MQLAAHRAALQQNYSKTCRAEARLYGKSPRRGRALVAATSPSLREIADAQHPASAPASHHRHTPPESSTP